MESVNKITGVCYFCALWYGCFYQSVFICRCKMCVDLHFLEEQLVSVILVLKTKHKQSTSAARLLFTTQKLEFTRKHHCSKRVWDLLPHQHSQEMPLAQHHWCAANKRFWDGVKLASIRVSAEGEQPTTACMKKSIWIMVSTTGAK